MTYNAVGTGLRFITVTPRSIKAVEILSTSLACSCCSLLMMGPLQRVSNVENLLVMMCYYMIAVVGTPY